MGRLSIIDKIKKSIKLTYFLAILPKNEHTKKAFLDKLVKSGDITVDERNWIVQISH